ncbi:hypothetical protein [Ornithinimicrobium sediminis]|uniref:hypothetical protein n=1 Tax=Ornithinimicrobium sediminis TaxID=2904603 RepID=UPI001E551806|nr:hypothetical protein [Ornithinimicrobium sediminis]MCE0486542.1 hypothetical protein [Ornithinimicrobium sediminis]
MVTHVDAFVSPGLVSRFLPGLHRQLDRIAQAGRLRSRVEGALPLVQGERLLALDCSLDGDWVAATDQALYCQVGAVRIGAVPTRWSRFDWDRIDRATWHDRDGTLALSRVGDDAMATRTVIHLPAGATLGRFARERVAWTIVVSATVQLDGGHGPVHVVVRRQPGSDDMRWQVTVPPGSAEVPGFRDAVVRALDELRGQWGL